MRARLRRRRRHRVRRRAAHRRRWRRGRSRTPPSSSTNDKVTAGRSPGSGEGPGQRGPRRSDRKTVIPAIIDTHTHLATTREALVDQLQRLAYYGIAATLSLGPGRRRSAVPGARRDDSECGALPDGGRGITMPEPGRTEVPYWITTEAEARKAVQELADRKVDMVKIWVDDRNGIYKKMTPALYGAVIDEAHKHKPARRRPHLYARGCEGAAARRHRRIRARRTRQGHRRRVRGDVQAAAERLPDSEPARPRAWRATWRG